MIVSADDLLAEAKLIYDCDRISHRDELLAVGRLLHLYILARLKTAAGMSEPDRLRAKLTRVESVRLAAAGLVIGRNRIKELISTAMAVDLLSEDGHCGGLGFSVLAPFAVLVTRETGAKSYGDRTDQRIEDTEVWKIKPAMKDAGIAFFRQAVRESLTQMQIKKGLAEVTAGKRRCDPSKHANRDSVQPCAEEDRNHKEENWIREEDDRTRASHRAKAAKVAAPKDVAEMCLELVEAAESPEAVIAHLKTMLDDLLARRKKQKRAWAS